MTEDIIDNDKEALAFISETIGKRYDQELPTSSNKRSLTETSFGGGLSGLSELDPEYENNIKKPSKLTFENKRQKREWYLSIDQQTKRRDLL